MKLQIGLAVVLAGSCLALDASAQPRRRGYNGITVFEHPDFRGDNVTFRDAIPDLREYRLNDRISSLELDGNQAWEVCQDINFGGRCRVFTDTIDDLRFDGWNDRISSIRPAGFARNNGRGRGWGNQRDRRNIGRAGAGRITLYDRTNYRGQSRDLLANSTNLGSAGDRARSVRVEGGTWELCEGVFRNARCVTIDNDVPDLQSLGLRNGVTSVREVSGNHATRRSRGWWP